MDGRIHLDHAGCGYNLEPVSPMISIALIQRVAAKHFAMPTRTLTHGKRERHIAYARNVAMYLSRLMTNASYPAIAAEFGGMDHSSIISACRRIAGLLQSLNPKTVTDVATIQTAVQEAADAEGAAAPDACPHCGRFWLTPERRKDAVADAKELAAQALEKIAMLEKVA